MPDPWLTEEELKQHEEEVANHPLTKQAEEAREAHKEDAEELRKQQAENAEKVESGELTPTYANGAVSGYRETENLSEEERLASEVAGIRPKAEGRGGNPEDNEIGPAGDDAPPAPAGNAESTEPSVEDKQKAEEKTQKRAAQKKEESK